MIPFTVRILPENRRMVERLVDNHVVERNLPEERRVLLLHSLLLLLCGQGL
jgi:hypothetical protein